MPRRRMFWTLFLPLLSLSPSCLVGAERGPWVAGRVHGSPEPPSRVRVERVFPALSFREPVDLVHEPGSPRWWVLEVGGRLLSFPDRAGASVPDLALNLNRPGVAVGQSLGFDFHPGFATNRELFLVYTVGDGRPDGSRLSRFRVSRTEPPVVDPESETILLTWPSGGHNGSAVRFGPDGFLHVSTGDGSTPEPPDALNTGQNLDDLLSCILRIDPDHPAEGRAFSIPRDNPFRSRPGARPEIWAYGFRNPWRMAFGPDGALWVGDVGWELWETVHRVTAGYNGGWSRLEGPQIIRGSIEPPTPVGEPIVAVPHSEFASLTGGVFAGESGLPWLSGAYVYGDFETGRIRAWWPGGAGAPRQEELCDTTLRIVSFAKDPAGGILVLDYRSEGGIHRLVENTVTGERARFPRKLSETGLFADTRSEVPAAGVVRYSVAAPRWQDHASSSRWLGVPGSQTVATRVGKESWERRWEFPRDSVLVKTLTLEMKAGSAASRKRIETQLLHQDGEAWQAYSYRWNEEGSDAELVPSGGDLREFTIEDAGAPGGRRRQQWRFASRSDCLRCHNTWSGPPLGFNFEQLSSTPAGDEVGRLAALGILTGGLERGSIPALVSPSDESAGVEPRARSWLHSNCAPCHRWGAGGAVAAYFNLDRSLAESRLLDVPPVRGTFGMTSARLVAPGEPWRSVIQYRIESEGSGHMPPIGSRRVDESGVQLVRRWIESLRPGATPPDPSRLSTDTSAALAFLGKHPQPPAHVVEAAVGSTNGAVRDLFQRHLPDSRRRPVLGPGFPASSVLGITGSGARGAELFRSESGPHCRRCHAVGGAGGRFGPPLDGVGVRMGPEELLEQMVQPSRRIAPEFVVHLVETRDGLVRTGFRVGKDLQTLRLRVEDGTVQTLEAGEVVSDQVSPVSAMPEGLLDALTAVEAADLLAYLRSLR